jgi:hypothetical protein
MLSSDKNMTGIYAKFKLPTDLNSYKLNQAYKNIIKGFERISPKLLIYVYKYSTNYKYIFQF